MGNRVEGTKRPELRYNDKGQRLCSARRSDGSGDSCHSPVVMPNGKCSVHGGKTPGGIASPHYRHGRYSQYLPHKARERYEAGLVIADGDGKGARFRVAERKSQSPTLVPNGPTGPTGASGDGMVPKSHTSLDVGLWDQSSTRPALQSKKVLGRKRESSIEVTI